MARYCSFVSKRVQVHYRAADVYLSAIGTLVSDSGKAIVLEDRYSQGGKDKTIRVEIPYHSVIRVSETHAEPPRPKSTPSAQSKKKS
jgi:hypothetical protein